MEALRELVVVRALEVQQLNYLAWIGALTVHRLSVALIRDIRVGMVLLVPLLVERPRVEVELEKRVMMVPLNIKVETAVQECCFQSRVRALRLPAEVVAGQGRTPPPEPR